MQKKQVNSPEITILHKILFGLYVRASVTVTDKERVHRIGGNA